jgi:WD40 repeat protein/formylglycine-generating enzyme required for sulfatase activity
LIKARLLTASETEEGIERIEVVHEALLSAWPRLVRWRQEDSEGARLRDQLRGAARQWEERKRAKGLLWRDDALAEYRLWRSRFPGKLTESEEAFAQASLAEADRNRRVVRFILSGIILILIVGSSILFLQQQRTRRQLLETIELYEEQGRQELLKNNPQGAAVYLSEAYLKGADNLALRFMLTQAMWSVEGRPPLSLESHTGPLNSASFSPDGKLIVTASADKTAKLWDATSGKLIFTLEGHKESLVSATFSPDGKLVVTASADRTARVWETVSGKLLYTLEGHNDGLLSAIFSPDRKLLVTASYDRTAKVWETATGKLLATLKGHEGPIYSAVFSPDGSLLITTSADRKAKLWSSESWNQLSSLDAHTGAVFSGVFSPDGKLIITAGADNTARLWESASGRLLSILADHKGGILSASFSNDGKLIVTASTDKTAKIWKVADGSLLYTLESHLGPVYSARFSPDDTFIVTASYDKSAKIWETKSGKFLTSLQDHKESVAFVGFSPDGKLIMTASGDKLVKLWNMQLETREAAQIAEVVKQRVPWRLEQGRLISTLLGKPVNANESVAVRSEAMNTDTTNREKNPILFAMPYKDVDSALSLFKFETVTLDSKGNIIESRKESAKYFAEDLSNGVVLEMVEIPAGSFIMGAPSNEISFRVGEQPQHPVTVSKFYMGKFEVTQRQWRAVASLPKVNRDLNPYQSPFDGDNVPVTQICWYDAVEFCERLSKATGREYRLPTEAEWEYACRAGTKTAFSLGETIASELVNFDGRGPYREAAEGVFYGKPLPVGSFNNANRFGLYDMHGNLQEWCMDTYHEGYNGAPTDGSAWIIGGKNRVLRGGSWTNFGDGCRSAMRFVYPPDILNKVMGFRVVAAARLKN